MSYAESVNLALKRSRMIEEEIVDENRPRFNEERSTARYRIRIYGHLDSSWSNSLGDMVITRAFTKQRQPMTILVGSLKDQAALSGVLNALYDLNYDLVSVENLDEK